MFTQGVLKVGASSKPELELPIIALECFKPYSHLLKLAVILAFLWVFYHRLSFDFRCRYLGE